MGFVSKQLFLCKTRCTRVSSTLVIVSEQKRAHAENVRLQKAIWLGYEEWQLKLIVTMSHGFVS